MPLIEYCCTEQAAWLGHQLPLPKEVEADWSATLRNVRAGMLAVPSRAAQRLPHLLAHDVSEIDAEIRMVLAAMARMDHEEDVE
jgi:phage terminase Nu1 subunit (DNA packaging protein)